MIEPSSTRATDTSFHPTSSAAPSPPPDIRYVVTLDSDTRLPHDTVRRLIGWMAHPLNRRVFDGERGAIVEELCGPPAARDASLPNGGEGSLSMFSSSSGVDPYAAAVSQCSDLSARALAQEKGSTI